MVNTLLLSNTNKLFEEYLGIQDVKFCEDLGKKKEFDEYTVKRSFGTYKKIESKRSVPFVNMLFTKNGKRYGIKISPDEFIENSEFDYVADDFVDVEDNRVLFIGNKPIRLPFQFYGIRIKNNLVKLSGYLKEKVQEIDSNN